MRIYVDLVMVLNFMVDLLLLLGTNRLSGHPPGIKRAIAASAVGAVYSGVCCLPGFRFLGSLFWRLVFLGIMGSIAFGLDKSAGKRCGIFVLLTMALGGVALAMNGDGFWMPILAAAGLWALCRFAFGGSAGDREYVPLKITYGGRTVSLTALRDSGNTLRDPISGEQVLVISPDAAGKLTGLSEEQLRKPLETLAQRAVPGLRLIPYRAVGQSGGMLLGMRMTNITVGNRVCTAVVAFAPDRIGGKEGYQALTGGVI